MDGNDGLQTVLQSPGWCATSSKSKTARIPTTITNFTVININMRVFNRVFFGVVRIDSNLPSATDGFWHGLQTFSWDTIRVNGVETLCLSLSAMGQPLPKLHLLKRMNESDYDP